MPTWTTEQLREYEQRRTGLGRSRLGTRPVLQKQEAVDSGPQYGKTKDVDRGKDKAVDGSVHPKFCVAVVMRYSDRRRRDNSGALETLLDCVVAAVGRLKAMDSNHSHHDIGG